MTIFEQYESNVRSYCRSFPAMFSRAKGSLVFDASGKSYIDFFAGAGALNYGHNNPEIKRRVMEYLESDGLMHALDVHTPAKRDFIEQFQQTILATRQLEYKLQFCGPTGTNSVEAALKLARKVTGRMGMFAFGGAYHGMTLGSMAVSGNRETRASAGTPLSHVTFIPYGDGPKGPFDSIEYMERLLEDSSSGVDVPAAVIVETVQMEGGLYVATPEWLARLRQITQKHGILLICDDIQAGCGRTGSFFSFERAKITPDLVTLSKSISGYGFPMALLLIRPDLDQWRPGEHNGTFRGHQLSFVGATAALDFWKDSSFEPGLQEKGRLLGQLVRGQLGDGVDVRGIGMAYGIDLVREGGAERARRVQSRCFEKGLIIESCGRSGTVLKILPPLTTEMAELEQGCAILHDALQAG
jgi:diaminobutyrate-2-oxoglutarate transaminase